jgi:hypothetical protein
MNHFTWDIEAYLDEKGNFVPYMLGIYGEELEYKSFYGTNCLNEAIKFILNHNYSSTEVTFYSHNGGKFDNIFLIKELSSNGIDSIRILKDRQNSIFCISFEYNGYSFTFKDSFKLMPMALDKLLKDFNINVGGFTGKLPFDHSWIYASNLNYVGSTPDWLTHMKEELIYMGVITNGEFSIKRYCELYNKIDCQGLHQLIFKFFHTLVKEFSIDFSFCTTLPQLALEVYRSKFLKGNKIIRLLSNRHYNFIKQAYKGPEVSVYKPYSEGRVYYYDVNSLFPYCMLLPQPVGSPKPYDVSKGLRGFFGFAEAIVSAPDIKIPVLPLKANINGTDKLIFPTGEFKGIFFSSELQYAESLGYRIKLIRGYSFEKSENLFTEFVTNFYNKKSSAKNGAIRTISKLILNSLYGRMAISKDFENNFITSNEFIKDQLLNLFSNIKPEPLNERSILFNFNVFPNPNLENSYVSELLQKLFFMSSENRVGNIAISAAIAAYARIYMHQFKMRYSNEVLYSDTDSLVLANKPLDPELIGDKIGQFKNVLSDSDYSKDKDSSYFISKALFLRDKVYSLVLKDGSQITKFAGLNRRLIPSDCFNLLYDAYISGNPIKLKNELLRRNISDLKVSLVEMDKIFTFNYDKRLQVYNEKGQWTDTLPININRPGANISQLIRKQQVALNDQRYGLTPFSGTINKAAICNTRYKHYDGYFLNYILPMKQDPITTLKKSIDLASSEGVLVPGVHNLITEYYAFRKNTINYLTNYVSRKELINIYSQHIDSV